MAEGLVLQQQEPGKQQVQQEQRPAGNATGESAQQSILGVMENTAATISSPQTAGPAGHGDLVHEVPGRLLIPNQASVEQPLVLGLLATLLAMMIAPKLAKVSAKCDVGYVPAV
jgi:hypothetical protein